VAAGEAELNKQQTQLISARAELNDQILQLQSAKQQLSSTLSILKALQSGLKELKTQSDAISEELDTLFSLQQTAAALQQLRDQFEEAMDQIRMAITVLEPRNDVGRCMFVKDPEPLRKDNTYRYRHVPEDLLRALDNIAERNQRRLPPPTVNFKGIVGKEPYPVARKATELVRSLILRGIQSLRNLFKGNRSRSEVVATFLAVLELCKTNHVSIEEDDSGENPSVKLIKEPDMREEVISDGSN
jgi:segregation and condensation protein A